MNIDVTLYGEIIFYSMFVVGSLSYYLGKRKTSTPKIVTLIGVALCIIPPLNIVYLIGLMLKNKTTSKQNIEV